MCSTANGAGMKRAGQRQYSQQPRARCETNSRTSRADSSSLMAGSFEAELIGKVVDGHVTTLGQFAECLQSDDSKLLCFRREFFQLDEFLRRNDFAVTAVCQFLKSFPRIIGPGSLDALEKLLVGGIRPRQ